MYIIQIHIIMFQWISEKEIVFVIAVSDSCIYWKQVEIKIYLSKYIYLWALKVFEIMKKKFVCFQ